MRIFGILPLIWACAANEILYLVEEPGTEETEETETDNISILETVGPEGGTLGATNETGTLTVEIPAGALDVEVEIGVEEIAIEDLSAAMEDLIDIAGGAYVFTPHGTTFADPVEITLPQTGIADTILRLDDEADMTWEMVSTSSFTANTASFQTSTFSVYMPASACSRYCQNVEDLCTSLDHETCFSTCEDLNISNPPETCVPTIQDNYLCLSDATLVATGFDCTTGAPELTTCEVEQAAALECVSGGNEAPSAPTVSITWTGIGGEPTELDDLICSGSGSIDPEGQTVTYDYSWTSDSGAIVDGATVSSSETLVSDLWTCTVIASDGSLSAQDSDTVEIISSYGWSNCNTTQTLNEAQLQIIGENIGDQAGLSVSSAGDVDGDGHSDILIGAYANDDGGTDSGKAYLILGSSLLNTSVIDLSLADYSFVGEAAGDNAGGLVSSAGDVDGDGLSDILIGASGNDDGGSDAGKAYLILGSSLVNGFTGDLSNADYSFVGEAAGDNAGYSVSSAGDVDGDAQDDILISSPFNDDGGLEAGKVYLILGSSLLNTSVIELSTADYSFTGEDTGDQVGISVSSAGDVVRDGLDDILIGAMYNDDGGYNAGKTYLISGASLGSLGSNSENCLSVADYSFIGEDAGDYSGGSVSSAGDIDGDGISDILIGAYGNDDGGMDSGKAYLIFGSSLGYTFSINLSSADYSFIGENGNDLLSGSVSSAGDVNGDGFDDILIGAYGNEDAGSDAGKAYLIFSSSLGSSDTINVSTADYSFIGDDDNDYAGISVSSAGDVDGDGFDDVLIGAYLNNDGGTAAGKVGLFKACSVQ